MVVNLNVLLLASCIGTMYFIHDVLLLIPFYGRIYFSVCEGAQREKTTLNYSIAKNIDICSLFLLLQIRKNVHPYIFQSALRRILPIIKNKKKIKFDLKEEHWKSSTFTAVYNEYEGLKDALKISIYSRDGHRGDDRGTLIVNFGLIPPIIKFLNGLRWGSTPIKISNWGSIRRSCPVLLY